VTPAATWDHERSPAPADRVVVLLLTGTLRPAQWALPGATLRAGG